jgi:hypothetical protein
MDIKQLERNAAKVHACLQETPDGRLIALEECKIYVPSRFEERGLMEHGVETYIVGIYAIVVEDKYLAVSMVNAMMRIKPSSAMKVKIRGTECYEFTFDAGSTIIASLNLVKNDVLVYKIYNEILSNGEIPWYLNYSDLGKLFDTAKLHAGANVGQNSEVTELIISLIARTPEDKVKYYRTIAQDEDIIQNKPATYVALKNVQYSATNTTDKLAGSYFGDALTSALINPSSKRERLESLLLK